MNASSTKQICELATYLIVIGVLLIDGNALSMEFARIYEEYQNEDYPNVLVTAHRGGYKHLGVPIYPENSLSAINYSIGLGVDIIEIDVRKTADGHLVVMHDSTVNRTTSGAGSVSSLTLAQIKQLQLLHLGQVTAEKVPTFEEVMMLAKGNIMVNIDKASDIMEDVIGVLNSTGTLDHAIFKGRTSNAQDAAEALNALSQPIDYMPILHTGDSIVNYFNEISPQSVEMIFSTPTSNLISPTVIDYVNAQSARVGMSSLFEGHAAGITDADALIDPAATWGWMVSKGAQIIQTDEPEALINFLASEGLRGGSADFNDDGIVDAADYTVWRDTVGQTGSSLIADANGDDVINQIDYELWSFQYESSVLSSITAVPEPESSLLIIMGSSVLLLMTGNHAHKLPKTNADN